MKKPAKKMKLKERSGFATFGMRLLYRLIYPFFHCKCEMPEEVIKGEGPAVFIANHYNVFGPVSFITSVPFNTYAWMNEELITPESTEEGLVSGIQSFLPFLSDETAQKISHRVSGTVCRVMHRFGAIPVSRNETSRFISTVRKSEAVLEQGHNLTIFPEIGDPEYSLTSVTPFFSGFATIGKLYAKRTGQRLRFYPVYIDEQHHVIRCGDPVYYETENEEKLNESERVSEELNRRIVEMANTFHGIEQKPLPRSHLAALGLCNLIRFLLLIPLLILLNGGQVLPILIIYGLSQLMLIVSNQILNTLSATNHIASLFCHGLSGVTALIMLFYLGGFNQRLYLPAILVTVDAVVSLFSNMHTYFKCNRCAGTNYFDILSINLTLILILKQLLSIRLQTMIFNILIGATGLFLICAMLFTVTFNLRILKKR